MRADLPNLPAGLPPEKKAEQGEYRYDPIYHDSYSLWFAVRFRSRGRCLRPTTTTAANRSGAAAELCSGIASGDDDLL
jgi:hypothetical protein